MTTDILKIDNPRLFLKIIRLSDLDKISLAEAQEKTYFICKELSKYNPDKNKAIYKDILPCVENFIEYIYIIKDLRISMFYDGNTDVTDIYSHYIQKALDIFDDVKNRWNLDDNETLNAFTLLFLINMEVIDLIESMEMIENIREHNFTEEECISTLRRARVASILQQL